MNDPTMPEATDPKAREQLYRFLATAYLQPLNTEAITILTSPGVLSELADKYGEDSVVGLRRFAERSLEPLSATALEREYMDLFAIPVGRYVTPFEDVYRGQTAERALGPLLGEHAVAVKRHYRAAGANVDAACKELPTHIGVELAFMAFLCGREALAERAATEEPTGAPHPRGGAAYYQSLQYRFLCEHLNAWFPQLEVAIRERATSDFYPGVAALTAVMLGHEAAWLESIVAPIEAAIRAA